MFKNLNINKDIVLFLSKILGFFVVWYVFYELWVLPDGRLDTWLSLNMVSVNAGLLSFLGFDIFTGHRIIGIAGSNGLEIVDGCNGLEAIGLFIGFVIAYPGDNYKRALFIPMGILAIYLLNLVRIFVLTLVQAYSPSIFGFMHDYSTSAIFYLAIFGMWVIWMNFGGKPGRKSDNENPSGTGEPTPEAAPA